MDLLTSGAAAVISDIGLFALRMVATVATVAFGIYGLDVKSRDESGKVTQRGKVVFAGIIASALISGIIQTGEFAQRQRESTEQLQRSIHLLQSIQENIYALKDVKAELEFNFRYTDEFTESLKDKFKEINSSIITSGEDCNIKLPKMYPGAGCLTVAVGSDNPYEDIDVSETSSLYPNSSSSLSMILRSLFARIDFYKVRFDVNNLNLDYSDQQIFLKPSREVTFQQNLIYNIKYDRFTYVVSVGVA